MSTPRRRPWRATSRACAGAALTAFLLTPAAPAGAVLIGSVSIQPVAVTGDAAPGTDSTFLRIQQFSIGNGGDVAFSALTAADQGSFPRPNSSGIWAAAPGSAPAPVALRTHDAPGLFDAQGQSLAFDGFQFGQPLVGGDGRVAFGASASKGSVAFGHGVWVGSGGAESTLLAPVHPFSLQAMNDAGEAALNITSSISPHPTGLFAGSAASVGAVAAPGDAAPGVPAGATFTGFQSGLPIGQHGTVAFRGLVEGGGVGPTDNRGVWTGDAQGLSLVARTGDAPPGDQFAAFTQFNLPTIGLDSELAFRAGFERSGANSFGIYRGSGPDDLQTVVHNRAVNLPTDDGLVRFTSLSDPVLGGPFDSHGGDLFFSATTLQFGPSIWRHSDGEQAEKALSLMVARGQAAPGAGGAVFDAFSAPSANAAGDIAFAAALSGEGVDNSNRLGLFVLPANGTPLMITRSGDVIDERFGPTTGLVPLTIGPPVSSSDGRSRYFSDTGEIVFLGNFADGHGLFRVSFESPAPGPFLWNGACGDTGWHSTCAGVTNWVDRDSGEPAPAPPGDAAAGDETARIESAHVTLQERATRLTGLSVTGEGAGLTVDMLLILDGESEIQNLDLGADLVAGGLLALDGENAWRKGTISGGTAGSQVSVAPGASLTLLAGEELKALTTELEVNGALALQEGAQLTLGGEGVVRNFGSLLLGGQAGFFSASEFSLVETLDGRIEAQGEGNFVGPRLRTQGGEMNVTNGGLSVTDSEHAGTGRFRVTDGSLALANPKFAGSFALEGEGLILLGRHAETEGELTATVRAQGIFSGLIVDGLAGAGTLINQADMTAGGVFVNAGGVVNHGSLKVAHTGVPLTVASELDNDGRVIGEDRKIVEFAAGGAIFNRAGGRYEHGRGAIGGFGTFVNDGGAFAKADQSHLYSDPVERLVPANDVLQVDADFNFLGGSVEVLSGKLLFTGDGQSSGSGQFAVAQGAALEFAGGSHSYTGDYAGGGMGDMILSGGTLVVADGRFVVDLDGPGRFKLAGGSLEGSGELVTRSATAWTGARVAGRLRNEAGESAPLVIPQTTQPELEGAFVNAGVVRSEGAPRLGPASIIQNEGLYLMLGGLESADSARFDNRGVFKMTSEQLLQPRIRTIDAAFDNTGTVEVDLFQRLTLAGDVPQLQGNTLAGGRWVVRSNGVLNIGVREITRNEAEIELHGNGVLNNLPNLRAGANFFNDGTLLLRNRALFQLFDGRFENNGFLFVDGTSTLNVRGSLGEFESNAGATTIIDGQLIVAGVLDNDGGHFGGSGTINAQRFNNRGTLAPGSSPGGLTIHGDFGQGAAGRLVIEIAGLLPGAEYDVLDVSGNVTLDGLLDLVFLDGFVPEIDDVFAFLLVGGELSGGFADVRVFGLGGASFDLAFDTSSGALRLSNVQASVPEPGPLGLIALGLTALLMSRRGRRDSLRHGRPSTIGGIVGRTGRERRRPCGGRVQL